MSTSIDLLDLLPEYHAFELRLAKLRFWLGEEGRILTDTLRGHARDCAAGALDRAALEELAAQARPVVAEWLDRRPLIGRGRLKRQADEALAYLAGPLAQALERRARAA